MPNSHCTLHSALSSWETIKKKQGIVDTKAGLGHPEKYPHVQQKKNLDGETSAWLSNFDEFYGHQPATSTPLRCPGLSVRKPKGWESG